MIDGNIVGYDFIYKKIGPARGVVYVALAFIHAGIDVCIVCDNKDNRHDSKRATIKRKGERERGSIQVLEKKIELTTLLRSADSESCENQEKRDSLNKAIRTLENKIGKVLPPDFIEQIIELIQNKNVDVGNENNDGPSIEVVVAPLQADPEVARRMITEDADCVVSGDSDYAMLLGPWHNGDIMIRKPH